MPSRPKEEERDMKATLMSVVVSVSVVVLSGALPPAPLSAQGLAVGATAGGVLGGLPAPLSAQVVSSLVSVLGQPGSSGHARPGDNERIEFVKRTIEEYENGNRGRRAIRNGRDLGPFGQPWWSRHGRLKLTFASYKLLENGEVTIHDVADADIAAKHEWVERRIRIGDDGWWRVSNWQQKSDWWRNLKPTDGGWSLTRTSIPNMRTPWWHEDTAGWWKDNFWMSHIRPTADVIPSESIKPTCDGDCLFGFAVENRWGHKRDSRNSCHGFYYETDPAELYVRGLVEMLNDQWRRRSVRPQRASGGEDPVVLSSSSRPGEGLGWPDEWPSRCR